MKANAGWRKSVLLAVLWGSFCAPLQAAELRIAVASNFADALRDIATAYQSETGNTVKISSGSTGKLYAQIKHGAPYDLFMSADAHRAELLAEEGQGIAESLRTYAVGQLVFLSRHGGDGECPLVPAQSGGKIAIANPDIAPYGLAARQLLEKVALWESLQSKFVRGENIAQAYQFFYSGNVDMAYVASAQVQQRELPNAICARVVPEGYHEPIIQKLVALSRSADRPEVEAFIHYMDTEAVQDILARYGYLVNTDL